ncbi:MAG: ATP-binding domain-containing protein [Chloroflexi bacterium]|nr:ATP-binding domain-containing protein [Chloroflexota bacterium]
MNVDINTRRLGSNQFELEVQLFQIISRLRSPDMMLKNWLDQLGQKLDLENLLKSYQKIRPDDVNEYDRLKKALRPGQRMANWTLKRFAKTQDKIQVTTLHSSKGMEFDIAIILGAEQINRNDRKLAYVGVTRAKKKVYLLYTGKSNFADEIREHSPRGFSHHTRH